MAIQTTHNTFKPHQFATFEEIDGRLAICTNTQFAAEAPVQEVTYRVSIHKTSDEYIAQFVGMQLSPASRYSGVHLTSTRFVEFPDWDTWDLVVIEEDCPKPRDGKEFTWRWDKDSASYQNRLHPERTGWVKENHPRCRNCHETSYDNGKGKYVRWSPYHSPDLIVAEECGWCHRGGVCDKRGVCRPYEG
jgi:hypothetical protein